MRIGVISDTHGQLEPTLRAIRLLQSLEVEVVLHCGDIGTPEVVRQFHFWPTHFVFGNCDYDFQALSQAVESASQICHGEFGDLTLAGVRIALLHSHDQKKFNQTMNSGEYSLICYGHTHIAKQEMHGPVMVLNPGAIHRANPPSIAIVDLPAIEVENIPL